MRAETERLITEVIYSTVIYPIDDIGYDNWSGNHDGATKLNAKEYAPLLYEELLVQAEEDFGYTRAIRFDGKKNIISAIEQMLFKVMEDCGYGHYVI